MDALFSLFGFGSSSETKEKLVSQKKEEESLSQKKDDIEEKKEDYHLVMVLDESGSMSGLRQDMVIH